MLETGLAALLFAATFLVGGRVHPLRALVRDRRSILSFGAGMSAAYVFVKLIPELVAVRLGFVEAVGKPLPFAGMAIYFVALVGFLSFYGLDHLRARFKEESSAQQSGFSFRLHVGGFAAYVWLMGYLLVHNLEETSVGTIFYAVAIAFHFLSLDHSLRHEHGAAYDRVGRYVLGLMAVLGWSVAQLFTLPPYVVALLVAFISGAIIMNSLIMELPTEQEGRFFPFMGGGIVYGLILLPLG
jgi:hypothetical protein